MLQHLVESLIDERLDVRDDAPRDQLAQWPALSVEDAIQEIGEALIEGSPECLVGERVGEVFGRQQPIPDGLADGGCESRLVLWDRALEEAHPPTAEQCEWVVGME